MNNKSLQDLIGEARRLQAGGKFQEALTKCFEATRVDAGDAEVLMMMGRLYRDLGQPAESIRIFELLQKHFPDHGDLLAELALSFMVAKDTSKAYELAKQAAELDQESDFCLEALGHIAMAYESWLIAADAYQKLAKLHPENTMVYRYWSNALNTVMHYTEAADVYQNVIRIEGMTWEHAFNMARFYLSARLFEKAKPYYLKAIDLDPKEIGPYLGLARVLIQFGDLEEGEKLVRKVLEIQPGNIYAFALLNDLKPEESNQKVADMLEEKISENRWDGPMDKAHTHLFLGKYYHKEKQFDRAFSNLKAYNDVRAELYQKDGNFYDRRVMEENFAESKKIFSREGLKKLEGCGSDSEMPVFIVAMPRSGTTLLEQIIATHSQVYGGGEMSGMSRIFLELNIKINEDPERDIYDIIRAEAKGWAEMYLESFNAPKGVLRVTDKMPVNFIYCGLIQAIFPNARIINIKRDPLDNCLSIFSNSFSESYAHSARLEDLGHYYNLYAGLMDHWKRTLSMKYLEVVYEDLVENQEAKSREILEFCLEDLFGIVDISDNAVFNPRYQDIMLISYIGYYGAGYGLKLIH